MLDTLQKTLFGVLDNNDIYNVQLKDWNSSYGEDPFSLYAEDDYGKLTEEQQAFIEKMLYDCFRENKITKKVQKLLGIDEMGIEKTLSLDYELSDKEIIKNYQFK